MGTATPCLPLLALAAAIAGCLPAHVRACSSFFMEDQLLVGRNYDWGFDEGMVVVNKRGQIKTALVYWGEDNRDLASWTSRYGSVTFVQYGREIALGGMNEAGLVVQEQWLSTTRYAPPDRRPSLSVDQYVQFLLDNFRSVDEIVAAGDRIRLRPTDKDFTKIHFFAADAAGDAATLEFLDGKLILHAKRGVEVKAMTNDTYEDSMAYVRRHGGPVPGSIASLDRFSRLAAFLSRKVPGDADQAVRAAFSALDSVKQGHTQLQVVFDVKRRVIHFRSRANPSLRHLAFDGFDYSCLSPSLSLDWNAEGSGDITSRFVGYSTATNESLIRRAWNGLGYGDVYPPAVELISRYPDSFLCSPQSR